MGCGVWRVGLLLEDKGAGPAKNHRDANSAPEASRAKSTSPALRELLLVGGALLAVVRARHAVPLLRGVTQIAGRSALRGCC
jgi:hypothetical protein